MDELTKMVKAALRLSSDDFDESEIKPIINAALRDLKTAGVVVSDLADALVERAVVLYAKANFGYIDSNGKFAEAYDALKRSMALCGDYNGGGSHGL